tara:strand:- start:2144 stop:2329 length:186 start_codon:yes stop_codon:yes gene_type:complete
MNNARSDPIAKAKKNTRKKINIIKGLYIVYQSFVTLILADSKESRTKERVNSEISGEAIIL